MQFNVIFAADEEGGFGKNNGIPWDFKEDRAHFRNTTTGGTIIMGRKTWESLPGKLPKRVHIVVSKTIQIENVIVTSSLEAALKASEGEVFVIGGVDLIRKAVNSPLCKKIYMTKIPGKYDCDVFISDVIQKIETDYTCESHDSMFYVYTKKS